MEILNQKILQHIDDKYIHSFFFKKDQNILKECFRSNFVSTVGPLVLNLKINLKQNMDLNIP